MCTALYREALPWCVCTALYREVLPWCVCTALFREASLDSAVHTRTTVTICCHNTDYVHVNRHDRTITVILAKHCIKLPDDVGAILNIFKYFIIILTVSTNYIFVHLLDNKVFYWPYVQPNHSKN